MCNDLLFPIGTFGTQVLGVQVSIWVSTCPKGHTIRWGDSTKHTMGYLLPWHALGSQVRKQPQPWPSEASPHSQGTTGWVLRTWLFRCSIFGPWTLQKTEVRPFPWGWVQEVRLYTPKIWPQQGPIGDVLTTLEMPIRSSGELSLNCRCWSPKEDKKSKHQEPSGLEPLIVAARARGRPREHADAPPSQLSIFPPGMAGQPSTTWTSTDVGVISLPSQPWTKCACTFMDPWGVGEERRRNQEWRIAECWVRVGNCPQVAGPARGPRPWLQLPQRPQGTGPAESGMGRELPWGLPGKAS